MFGSETRPLHDQLFQFLVSLHGHYQPIIDGVPQEPRMFACSGFIVELRGVWFYATSGHHFLSEGVFYEARKGRVKIREMGFVDSFHRTAKNRDPIPFSFDYEKFLGVELREMAADYALVPIRDFYRQALAFNVMAINEQGWGRIRLDDFDEFYVVGVPDEMMDREGAGLTPVMYPLKRLEALPDNAEPLEGPWFVGKFAPNEDGSIPRMAGMSGGPIFGLKRKSAEKAQAQVVAVQSGAYQRLRTVHGAPLAVFLKFLLAEFDKRAKDDAELKKGLGVAE